MKKKAISKSLSIILAVLLIFSAMPMTALSVEGSDPFDGNIKLSGGDTLTIYDDGYEMNADDKVAYAGDYTLSGGSKTDPIAAYVKIAADYDAGFDANLVATKSIILGGLNLSVTDAAPFELVDGAKVGLVLEEGSENTLTTSYYMSAALQASSSSKLTISANGDESGALTATSALNGAGIGGMGGKPAALDIFSGNITAVSGNNGAAIGGGGSQPSIVNIYGGNINAECLGGGSGIGGPGSTVTISGGTITAKSAKNAGIGSGKTGKVTISGGNVTATSGDRGAGIGGGNGETSGTIIISGGTVTASSTENGAGIGAGNGKMADSITISGGTIEVTSGTGGAGIGGGYSSSLTAGGIINISGGTITATGGEQGAGIGGGRQGVCEKIEISGGDITATGGRSAAGIGSGDGGAEGGNGDGKDIIIKGNAVIKATGGFRGAGIGGGIWNPAGNINISDGDIIAKGGEQAAGIGSGSLCVSCGTINITGGNITAETGDNGEHDGAGIGGGYTNRGGTTSGGAINISGGTITANGKTYGTGIGSGESSKFGVDVTISGGIISASSTSSSGSGIGSGKDGKSGTITITGGTIAASNGGTGTAIGGSSTGSGGAVIIEGGSVLAESGAARANYFNNAPTRSDPQTPVFLTMFYLENVTKKTQLLGGTINGTKLSEYTYGINDVWSDENGKFYFYLPAGNYNVYLNTSEGTFGGGPINVSSIYDDSGAELDPVVLPITLGAGDYLWLYDGGYSITSSDTDAGNFTHAHLGDYILNTTAETEAYVRVTGGYNAMIDPETGVGGKKIVLAGLNLKTSSSSPFELKSGASASIVLAENSVNVVRSTSNNHAGLSVTDGAHLAIDAKGEDGTLGKLNAYGGYYSAGIGSGNSGTSGDITIIGGKIVATSSNAGAGIGGGYNQASGRISISGGEITATSQNGGAGIGGGYGGDGGITTISGGTVSAIGRTDGTGIGGGLNGAGGTITITGGTVSASSSNDKKDIGGGANGVPGTVTIDGGSVNAKKVDTPKNSRGENVYLSALTIFAAGAKKVVTAGNLGEYTLGAVPSSGVYGINDMQTDVNGKLYVYLPEDEYASSTITVDSSSYIGYFKTNSTAAAGTAYILPNFTVTGTVMLDCKVWKDTSKSISLRDAEGALEADFSDGVLTALGVPFGTYGIYDGDTKRVDVEVEGANVAKDLLYTSSPKITSFKLGGHVGVIDEESDPKTITLEVPTRDDVSNIKPTIVTSPAVGATVSPADEQDFSGSNDNPIEYTVTLDNEDTMYLSQSATYMVRVVPKIYEDITLDPTVNKYLYIYEDSYVLSALPLDDPKIEGSPIAWDSGYRLAGGATDNTIEAYVKVMADFNSFDSDDEIVKSIMLNGLNLAGGRTNFTLEADTNTSSGAKVNLILAEGSKNSVKTVLADMAGLRAPKFTTLRIDAEGTGTKLGQLSSTAKYGAGIGGNKEEDSGNIVIANGDITAFVDSSEGNAGGAGIGGGYKGSNGTLSILGGKVSATGGTNASGIGGASEGSAGTISISGGEVSATSGSSSGAGIGGGSQSTGGSITISGGKVTATGKDGGAGIGGGMGGNAGTINISGGDITATGGSGAAGIGGGMGGNAGTINISGGEVIATGGRLGVGIGGGSSSKGGSVTISGGKVTATGDRVADIGKGGGASAVSVTIDGGSIKAVNGNVDTPVNSAGKAVYLSKLTVVDAEKDPMADEAVTAGKIGGVNMADTPVAATGVYGKKDMMTDGDGKLYIYMPAGEYLSSSFTLDGTARTGYFKTNAIAPTSYTLPNYTLSAAINKDGELWTDFARPIKFAWGGQYPLFSGLSTPVVANGVATLHGLLDEEYHVVEGAGDPPTADLGVSATIAGADATMEINYISEPQITSFTLAGKKAVIDQSAGTILVTVPSGTKLKDIEPQMVMNAAHVSADKSGEQDFSDKNSPVEYTVSTASALCLMTAPKEKTYTVEIKYQESVLPPSNPIVTPNDGDDTYTAHVPPGSEGQPMTFTPTKGETVDAGTVLRVTAPADKKGDYIGKSVVNADGSISFIVPDGIEFEVVNNAKRFDDVNDEWFAGNVDFTSARELFLGTTKTKFSPQSPMTRAMFATILWRLELMPIDKPIGYDDINSDEAYYFDAVNWAAKSGVVEGVGGNRFAPKRDIIRQDLVLMMYRYAKYLGMEIDEDGDLSQFTDAGDVSEYAVAAMKWAVKTGIIEGKKGMLDPKGNATRAECSAILQRFVEHLVENGRKI